MAKTIGDAWLWSEETASGGNVRHSCALCSTAIVMRYMRMEDQFIAQHFEMEAVLPTIEGMKV